MAFPVATRQNQVAGRKAIGFPLKRDRPTIEPENSSLFLIGHKEPATIVGHMGHYDNLKIESANGVGVVVSSEGPLNRVHDPLGIEPIVGAHHEPDRLNGELPASLVNHTRRPLVEERLKALNAQVGTARKLVRPRSTVSPEVDLGEQGIARPVGRILDSRAGIVEEVHSIDLLRVSSRTGKLSAELWEHTVEFVLHRLHSDTALESIRIVDIRALPRFSTTVLGSRRALSLQEKLTKASHYRFVLLALHGPVDTVNLLELFDSFEPFVKITVVATRLFILASPSFLGVSDYIFSSQPFCLTTVWKEERGARGGFSGSRLLPLVVERS